MTLKRNVLVTGGGGGIGAAIVKSLLKEGHKVAAADIDFSTFPDTHPSLLKLKLDLRDDLSCREVINKTIKTLGNIDTHY